MIATLMLSALLSSSQDAWELKPPFETGKKVGWSVSVSAQIQGMDIEAKFDHFVTPEAPASDGVRVLKIDWMNTNVNGQPDETPQAFDVKVGSDGTLQQVTSPAEDEYRRCLSVFAFVYPAQPVKVGDKWTSEYTAKANGAKKMKSSYEVAELTKIGETDVLKIVGKLEEEGEGGISSANTWWVAKTGAIVKFKLDVKNWVVPFTGAGAFDATIAGEKK